MIEKSEDEPKLSTVPTDVRKAIYALQCLQTFIDKVQLIGDVELLKEIVKELAARSGTLDRGLFKSQLFAAAAQFVRVHGRTVAEELRKPEPTTFPEEEDDEPRF